uniref:Uncharacterized protein n=1 Tax=Cacopsylla melanoneura TaxID=428564 RepID=A0A8D9EC26_9HEMI
MITHAFLNSSSPSSPLSGVGQTDPLWFQGCNVVLHVKVVHLGFATVHDVDYIVNCDGRLCYVRGQDDLANPFWRSVEYCFLRYSWQHGVKRYDLESGRVEELGLTQGPM